MEGNTMREAGHPPPLPPFLKGKVTMKELEKYPEIKKYWLNQGRFEGVFYTSGGIILMAIAFVMGGWIL